MCVVSRKNIWLRDIVNSKKVKLSLLNEINNNYKQLK